MARAQDIAAFIKRHDRTVAGMRLQKLMYYCQAWSVVWDGQPLFAEEIQAWSQGPVEPTTWKADKIGALDGNPDALSAAQVQTVSAVLDAYGRRSGEWLSRLTHREEPWRAARGGLPPDVRSKAEIPVSSLGDYYGRGATRTKAFDAAYLRGLEMLVEIPEEEVPSFLSTSTQDGAEFLRWLESGDT